MSQTAQEARNMVYPGVSAISFDAGLYHSILYHRGTVTDLLWCSLASRE
jgi:hypothetical protein